MSSNNDADGSPPHYQHILDAASAKYLKDTGRDLVSDQVAVEIQSCESPNDVLNVVKRQAEKFDEFRKGDSELMKYLEPIVSGLHVLFANKTLSAGVSQVFPPAKMIFSGISILLNTAKDVKKSYDTLVDLFECIEHFLRRLEIYAEIPCTPAITEVLIKIMVEVLAVLALSTKQMKTGKFKNFAKKLLGDNDVQAVLGRLGRLTEQESQATGAHTLEIIYGLVHNMTVVMEDSEASMKAVLEVLSSVQQLAEEMNRDKIQKYRVWLAAQDPWTNHNNARKAYRAGTATWFTEGYTFQDWKTVGSLFWIHGSPGSGKSILCSTIIENVQNMRQLGLATVAIFYFDFSDKTKQDARNLLSSLLTQLSVQSDSFCGVLAALYSEHEHGFREPSQNALLQCLKKMLELPGQAPLYIILDGVDECPNPSGSTSPRGKVLEVIEELIKLHHPHLRLSVTSRSEADIKPILGPLSTHQMSLHDQIGQAQDIATDVESVIREHRRMREWPDEVKKLVTDTLSKNGGGMFQWASLQLNRLCDCPLQDIEEALKELPETLDGTYERILRNIGQDNRKYAHRIFQWLTVSVRPLRVEEVAEVFAIRIDAGSKKSPTFDARWRPPNAEEAVLLACSALVAIVDSGDFQVVQFSHFSVKEYLTSSRLANSNLISRYHIPLLDAHTFLARVCLCILLQLDDKLDKSRIKDFPLAKYAAQYWISHAQFEGVSSLIQDEMNCLFDKDKSHFANWVWLYDIDDPRMSFPLTGSPEQPDASPLYYAALCGFRDTIERLIGTSPEDVNPSGGDRATPLHAALLNGHLEVVLFLLENGADVDTRDNEGETPLHLPSRSGDAGLMRVLLDHGADPNSVTDDDPKTTPLLIASEKGDVVAARLLLERGADINPGYYSPLKMASRLGHCDIAQLLFDHGANADEQDRNGEAPLHVASSYGQPAIARMLIERGASVDLRTRWNETPLHMASQRGSVEVVRVLLDCGADVNAQDESLFTPLHVAAKNGHIRISEVLLEHDADLHLRAEFDEMPWQVAMAWSHDGLAGLLANRAGRETWLTWKRDSELYRKIPKRRLTLR